MGRDLTERGSGRVQAPAGEGAGYGPLPRPRNPAHGDPNWYQLDTDDAIEDPDEAIIDPLPTPRHRNVLPL
jgi:hypothetical protein